MVESSGFMMDELLTHINTLYGLKVKNFEKVTRGYLSENYFLFQDDKRYFLKKYRVDDKERIQEIFMSKKFFSDGGIPVILPIMAKDGSYFSFFKGNYFTLFTYVDERQLMRGNLSNTAIISLGEMLGKIHLLGKNATLPISVKFKMWNREKSLQKIDAIESQIKKISTPSLFDKLALENVCLKRRLILENRMNYEDLNLPNDHLIHGDYLDHNVFFGDDDKVVNVFDFEKTCYAPRMYELIRSMMYSFLSEDIQEKNIERAKLYLDSYCKVYPTSKEEISKGLKLFNIKRIGTVWLEGEHYLNDNNRADHFLLDDFQREKYLSEHLADFEQRLLQ